MFVNSVVFTILCIVCVSFWLNCCLLVSVVLFVLMSTCLFLSEFVSCWFVITCVGYRFDGVFEGYWLFG